MPRKKSANPNHAHCPRVYKHITERAIADAIAAGVYRFYELTKYVRMEDDTGRGDTTECSVSFPEDEVHSFPTKLPVASLNGVEFFCASIKPDDAYVRQYFVFCTSLTERGVFQDTGYAVELETDIFDTLAMILGRFVPLRDAQGLQRFSHGPVEYYDIHMHPTPLSNQKWKEVFVKHSRFRHQQEYRASIFAQDALFDHMMREPLLLELEVFGPNGVKKDFRLKVSLAAGVDSAGWRYIDADIAEFARNLGVPPSRIIHFGSQ